MNIKILKFFLLVSLLVNVAFIYWLNANDFFVDNKPHHSKDMVPSNDVNSNPDKNTKDAILAELELERAIRLDLESELVFLQHELEALVKSDFNTLAVQGDSPVEDDSGLTAIEDRLAFIGLDEDEIENIKSRYNQYTLQRLELLNQLGRVNGKDRRRLGKAIISLKEDLRNDFGDEQYDNMLYATLQLNRVEVTEVLPNSAAASVGLAPGDLIVSYAGEKVFTTTAIFRQTQDGELNESTEITIQRGQELITYYVPRGVLGTRFKGATKEPLNE